MNKKISKTCAKIISIPTRGLKLFSIYLLPSSKGDR